MNIAWDIYDSNLSMSQTCRVPLLLFQRPIKTAFLVAADSGVESCSFNVLLDPRRVQPARCSARILEYMGCGFGSW